MCIFAHIQNIPYLDSGHAPSVTAPSHCCCKYASAVCYSLWLYYGMLLEDYMDRVSDRLLSETSTSEMAIDGRRRPCTTRSDIKRLVYISHSPYW
jgi:hypothetical protein